MKEIPRRLADVVTRAYEQKRSVIRNKIVDVDTAANNTAYKLRQEREKELYQEISAEIQQALKPVIDKYKKNESVRFKKTDVLFGVNVIVSDVMSEKEYKALFPAEYKQWQQEYEQLPKDYERLMLRLELADDFDSIATILKESGIEI